MVAILFYLIIQLQLLIASPLFPFTLKLLERNFKPSHKVSFSTYTAGKISQFIGTASFLSLQLLILSECTCFGINTLFCLLQTNT